MKATFDIFSKPASAPASTIQFATPVKTTRSKMADKSAVTAAIHNIDGGKKHRLALVFSNVFMDQARLRVGDKFEVAVTRNAIYLKPADIGFSIHVNGKKGSSHTCRMHCPPVEAWGLDASYRANMVSWSQTRDGMIVLAMDK